MKKFNQSFDVVMGNTAQQRDILLSHHHLSSTAAGAPLLSCLFPFLSSTFPLSGLFS